MDFAQAGTSLDFEAGHEFSNRFSGVNGSLQIAGVDGIEFRFGEPLRNCLCLDSAPFRQRRIEVALCFVV